MIEYRGASWLTEELSDGLTRMWRIDEVLHTERTAFQDVLVARTAHGVSLFCDQERQSTELTQLVYHEALTIPPVLLAERLDRCLVIGSSEGVACQLLVQCGARRVDHVDIDARAVDLCARYLPFGYSRLELDDAENGRGPIKVVYEDGYAFIENAVRAGRGYDVIIVDLPDASAEGTAQHDRLYGAQFLELCERALAPGGAMCTQAGCPTMWRNATLAQAWRKLTARFPTVTYFGSDEHEWAFLSARREELADPLSLMIERLATLAYRPVSIDGATLRGGSVVPVSVRTVGAPAAAPVKRWRRRPFGGPSPR